MTEQRKRRYRQFNKLYEDLELRNSRDWNNCFYCGQPSDTIDHQPPISVIEDFISSGILFEAVRIPCCLECNTLLSNMPTKTLPERFNSAKIKLRKRYKKDVKAYETWDAEALAELGYALRKMIEASIFLGKDATERISYSGHDLVPTINYWYDYIECDNCGSFYKGASCPECRP